jgi:hypothetical protein
MVLSICVVRRWTTMVPSIYVVQWGTTMVLSIYVVQWRTTMVLKSHVNQTAVKRTSVTKASITTHRAVPILYLHTSQDPPGKAGPRQIGSYLQHR